MRIDYPFTEQEMQAAADEWGANCGPSALAFALQIGIDVVRGKIPGFEEKRYTSPTMMKAGLANLGFGLSSTVSNGSQDSKRLMVDQMFREQPQLVRIQWTGPWTNPGANPKWAYRQTHWIATWELLEEQGYLGEMSIINMVFDCNGGMRTFESWQTEIVPILTAMDKRSDGGWFPTHVWRPSECVALSRVELDRARSVLEGEET